MARRREDYAERGGVSNREQRSCSRSQRGGGLEKLDRGRDRGETFFPDSGSDRDSDETFQISRNLGLELDEFVCLLDPQLWFCSPEQISELFSLPRNGSERNSASLFLFLFHGTEFRSFFSSAENGIPRVSVSWNSRNSPGTNQLFRLFRLPQNIYLS